MMFTNIAKWVVGLSLVAGLAACGGGGGGGSSSAGTGTLSLGVTDGPVETADAVVVAFDAVEVKPASGDAVTITLDGVQQINLLDYQGGERVLLVDDRELVAGAYNWIRLAVVENDSYIEVNGSRYPLTIPSGAQSGLKMNRGFTVAAGGSVDFTVDFDLRKSVVQNGVGDYKLRPTVRLLDTLQTQTLTGTVDAGLITDVNCNNGANNDQGNVVYLYAEQGATPQDIQGNADDPVITATVSFNNDSGNYEYALGFIEDGEYTLAFTCDASLDVADEDNSAAMNFATSKNIAVPLADGQNANLP
jgi:hypothetical protein